jgi:23S rRNA (guanosine2251-2'-O)-methyltransferase
VTEEALVVWGIQPVMEALRAGTARTVLLLRSRKPSPVMYDLRDLAESSRVPIREVDETEIARLSAQEGTQGVAAEVTLSISKSAGALLRTARQDRPALILALDQVQDPHNLGALIRSADAAGVQGVVYTGHRSAPITGTVAKTSAGAIHHVPLARITNLASALGDLRQAGLWIVGLDEDAEDSIFGADLTMPLCLVVGGEGSGLRRLTRERCDFLVRLPMLGAVGSLNASVAGAIAMFEVVRQRNEA